MGRKKNESPKPRNRRREVGLDWYQEAILREQLLQLTPSEPWIEEQIISVFDVDASGMPIHYRYHKKNVFPPGGAETAMIRCPRCGVFTPPNAMEHGLCLDHARHKGWGPSPSARTIRKLQRYHIHEENPLVLEPEDEESLLREIEEWKQQNQETETLPQKCNS